MALKSAPKIADRKTRVFLSYSRKDIEFAQLLKTELEAAGFHPMLDKTDIAPGENWQDRLGKLIIEADAVVFSVSPNSAASKICGWEIGEAERLGKRIIPVVIDPVDTGTLPEALTRLNFIFFSDVSFDVALGNLVSALNTDLKWVRQHTRLGELAGEWQTRGSNRSRLLRGAVLGEAEHWLATQPQDANQPTELQRQFIAASRKRASTTQRNFLVGAITVALVSIALLIWGEINRQEAIAARDKAERLLLVATNASGSLIDNVVEQFKSQQGVPLETIKAVLEETLKLPGALKNAGASNSSVEMAEVKALLSLSDILVAQGHSEEALNSAKRAVEVMEPLSAQNPSDQTMLDFLSTSYNKLALALNITGDLLAATSYYEKDLAVARKISSDQPDNLNAKRNVAVSLERVGSMQLSVGNIDSAFDNFVKGLEIMNEIVAQAPENTKWSVDVAIFVGKLGDIWLQRGENDKALETFQGKLEIAEALVATNPRENIFQNSLATGYRDLGRIFKLRNENVLAEVNFKKALETSMALVNNNPGNASLLNELSISYNSLGRFYLDTGDKIKAGENYAADFEIAKSLSEADPNDVSLRVGLATSHFNLAETDLNKRDNLIAAREILEAVLKKQNQTPIAQSTLNLVDEALAKLPKE